MKITKSHFLFIGALAFLAVALLVTFYIPEILTLVFSALHSPETAGGGLLMAMSYGGGVMVPNDTLAQITSGLEKLDEKLKKAASVERVEKLEGQVGEIATLSKLCQDLRSDVNTARKQMILSSFGSPGQLAPGQVVSEGCAHYLAGVLIQCALAQGKLDGHKQRDQLLEFSASAVRIVGKTAITTSDIPVPTEFGKEIVALVWKYGQFRQYARVYPLGASPTKLPKLKTSPAFGVIAQSAAVTEKSPQTEYVTFTPFKSGGLLRIPSEIDADTLGALGQFLAEYVSREAARWEDVVGFTGDGTSTYGSVSGVCKHADTQSKLVQLGAGMTSPADITLADLRLLRTKVDQAALMDSAYYMSMTMEAHLTSYNISANVTPYIANSLLGSRLDGFPIRWVGVMPSFDTGAHAGQYQVAFGNLQYWFLGERAGWDIQTSRDVFFATDEIAMRALNRMDIHAMADAAMAVLKLAS